MIHAGYKKIIPTVYICTAVHNKLHLTEKFLDSIFANNYKSYKVILVDDGSTDKTRSVIKNKYPNVILIKGDGNLWWTGGINTAIKKSISLANKNDFILTINNDLVVDKDFISSLVKTSTLYNNSIVGTIERQINTNKINSGYLYIDWKNSKWINNKVINSQDIKLVDWLTTKGTIFPLTVFNKLGLLDENKFPHYGSDVEYTSKAKSNGYKLLVNSSVNVYSHTENTGISYLKDDAEYSIRYILMLAFSRKSTVNLIDHYHLIQSICPKRYKLINYIRLILKAAYLFTLPIRKFRLFKESKPTYILFDYQIFSWQQVGGISRYFTALISVLNENNNIAYKNLTFPLGWYQNNGVNKSHIYLRKIIQYALKIKWILIIIIGRYKVFHPTYYDPYFLKYIGSRPFVITVYDMIHELFPRYFKGDKTHEWKKSVIKSASHIIAISKSTKNDLVKLLNVSPRDITVIPLASNIDVSKATFVELPDKFILFVGERQNYKNFIVLLKAILQVMYFDPSIMLVAVGGKYFTDVEKEIMGKMVDRFIQLELTDAEIAYAYSKAMCLVVPSLYEGFGLPVLEAMMCGCPVISSNTSSLPEVGGDAPLYFEPKDSNKLASLINMVMTNQELRANMITLGYKQAKKFTIRKLVKSTLNVYKNVILEENKYVY